MIKGMDRITVVAWISDDDTGEREVALGGWGGWFGFDREENDEKRGKVHHRWKDYVEDLPPECVPYAEALREACVKHNIRITGLQHQNEANGVPVFSDGKIGSFSFSAWGDLMAAIWSEAENRDHNYMDFYM
jgi:hypothetical protein